jgi:anion-transporting  ArsA/GET3 family ATPase
MSRLPTLDELVAQRRILVCIGSGGVGKTTTSAVIALHAALQGRKTLVLTIDPARRLANSLGVAQLDNEERKLPLDAFKEVGLEPKGELWAMMLDMKRSFDRLVDRYAPDPETRDKIYANRFYQYFSTSLAGTQEYSAMERLYALYEEGNYDLIVLDTPPSVHALDFLDAPNRMADAIENSALQWMYKPSLAARNFGFGLFNVGTSYVLKTISTFTGSELLDELGPFLMNFKTMFDGFRGRARHVREILGDPQKTSFLVVTSPAPLTVDEARYLQGRLSEEKIPFGGFIVNRVHKTYASRADAAQSPEDLAADLAPLAELDPQDPKLRALSQSLLANASEFQTLADLDAQTLAALRERVHGEARVWPVPYFSRDIHSIEGLNQVRKTLFEGSGP